MQVVLELDRRWESEPVFSARRHVARKVDEIKKNLTQQGLAQMEVEERIPEELHTILAQLRQNNLDEYTVYMSLPNFFESVGALADRGDAHRLWAGAIVGYYRWFGRHINARREAEHAPEMYQELIALARWCEKRRTGTG